MVGKPSAQGSAAGIRLYVSLLYNDVHSPLQDGTAAQHLSSRPNVCNLVVSLGYSAWSAWKQEDLLLRMFLGKR